MIANVLLVDDDEGVLGALERVLLRGGYNVRPASDAATALRGCRDDRYDVVISDYRMPEMDGIEFLNTVRELHPGIVRIMLSGEADRQAMLASINEADVFRFLTKPWEDEELLDAVAEAIAHRHANHEAAEALEFHRKKTDRDYQRQQMLDELEKETPGITDVNWSPNQTIIIEDSDV